MSAVRLEMKGGEIFKRHLFALAAATRTARGLRVGFLENATYPATPSQEMLHIAQVAFWNEFGTSRAPARPSFRNMIRRQEGGWGHEFGGYLRGAKFDAATALQALGISIKDELTNEIASWPADNAPSTVRRKGFNHGLVDKGLMQHATDFEVLR